MQKEGDNKTTKKRNKRNALDAQQQQQQKKRIKNKEFDLFSDKWPRSAAKQTKRFLQFLFLDAERDPNVDASRTHCFPTTRQNDDLYAIDNVVAKTRRATTRAFLSHHRTVFFSEILIFSALLVKSACSSAVVSSSRAVAAYSSSSSFSSSGVSFGGIRLPFCAQYVGDRVVVLV